LEKSAQLVSVLVGVGGVLQAGPGTTATGEVGGGGEELLGLEAGAVELPVSMGISSKFAVHTGPETSMNTSWDVGPVLVPLFPREPELRLRSEHMKNAVLSYDENIAEHGGSP